MNNLSRIEPLLGCGLGGVLKGIIGINGAVPLIHGPMSCASGHRIIPLFGSKEPLVPSTSLTEIDAVMGTKEKLINAIEKIYTLYKPPLIVIILTCATSLTSELFGPLLDSLQKELNIPIFLVDGSGITGDEIYGFREFYKQFVQWKKTQGVKNKNSEIELIGLSPADYDSEKNLQLLNRLITEFTSLSVKRVLFQELDNIDSTWDLLPSIPCGHLWAIEKKQQPAPYGADGTYAWLKYVSMITKSNLSLSIEESYLNTKKLINKFKQSYSVNNLKIAIEAESWWGVGLSKFFSEELGCKVLLSSDIDAFLYQKVNGEVANTIIDTGNVELTLEFDSFSPDMVFGSSYVKNHNWGWEPFWHPIYHVVDNTQSFMGWRGVSVLLTVLERVLSTT